VKSYIHLSQYVAELFLELELPQTKVVEKIKTHFMFTNVLPENYAVYKIMQKNMVEPDAKARQKRRNLHAG
jgi:hypothetical protein